MYIYIYIYIHTHIHTYIYIYYQSSVRQLNKITKYNVKV